MSDEIKIIQLNASQSRIHIVNANVTYACWPRAGGKTTGGIGPRVERLSKVMPRSQVLLYSDTFERIHDRLVPNIAGFWQNEMGLQEGVDYVLFKKPPEHWTKPLLPLNKFDHVISFSDGFSVCCASQKVPGSGNAYNAQALIVDETKYIKEEKVNTEVLPALRGAKRLFGHLPEYRSHWYFTDKWGHNIKWILAKKKLCDERKINAVITLQMEVFRLQQEMVKYTSTRTEYKYKNQIIAIENKLNILRSNMVYFSEAQPYENLDALGEKYFRDLKRDMDDYEYRVAILNEDPDKVMNTFYPNLNPTKHYYKQPGDINPNAPLIIAMDYNWRITPMAVAQYNTIPGAPCRTLNIVAGIHTLHPDGGIEQTCRAFAQYFNNHQNKIVHYIFDHTTVSKSPVADPYYEIATRTLQKEGWTVVQHYIGQAPVHGQKYETIMDLMNRTEEDSICINEQRCEYMIKSIQQAGAITSGGKTKKDKSKEKDLSYPAEETTDYSDAFDTLIWGTLHLKVVPPSSTIVGTGIAVR